MFDKHSLTPGDKLVVTGNTSNHAYEIGSTITFSHLDHDGDPFFTGHWKQADVDGLEQTLKEADAELAAEEIPATVDVDEMPASERIPVKQLAIGHVVFDIFGHEHRIVRTTHFKHVCRFTREDGHFETWPYSIADYSVDLGRWVNRVNTIVVRVSE